MGRAPADNVAVSDREGDSAFRSQRRVIEGLRELRQTAGKAQADIASALNITQPSVSKIERQNDMHLSTLRNYVEAVGGELELTVRLPKRPALLIHHLGDLPLTNKKSGDASPRRRHG